jgi:hypothetical protein
LEREKRREEPLTDFTFYHGFFILSFNKSIQYRNATLQRKGMEITMFLPLEAGNSALTPIG